MKFEGKEFDFALFEEELTEFLQKFDIKLFQFVLFYNSSENILTTATNVWAPFGIAIGDKEMTEKGREKLIIEVRDTMTKWMESEFGVKAKRSWRQDFRK